MTTTKNEEPRSLQEARDWLRDMRDNLSKGKGVVGDDLDDLANLLLGGGRIARKGSTEHDAPHTGRGPEELRLRIGFERMKRRADAAEAKLRRVERLPDEWEARAIEQTKETKEVFGPQAIVMSAVLEQLVRGVAAELREALKEEP